MWVNATSNQSIFFDLLCCGYTLDDNETFVTDISSSELPDNFPLPCTCGKCVPKYWMPNVELNQLVPANIVNGQKKNVKIPKQQNIYDR